MHSAPNETRPLLYIVGVTRDMKIQTKIKHRYERGTSFRNDWKSLDEWFHKHSRRMPKETQIQDTH